MLSGDAALVIMAGTVCGDCNGLTQNVVRYDSPTFGGFSVSASWGEDDIWDVAARYAGEFNGFKLAAAAAYSDSTRDCNVNDPDRHRLIPQAIAAGPVG